MLSLPLTIVCLTAVLPIHLTSCGDPMLSAEAQAVYNINPNGVNGGNCFSVPTTFEMRVDGFWMPTSEFGLTGNFDEDCGIQIHLSIPEGDDQLKKTGDLKTARNKINNDKMDLLVKEDALEEEKKTHEKIMEELKEEMNTVEETEDKLNELMTDETDLEKRMEDNVRRRNLLKEKKEKLGKDLDTAIKENEENRVNQEMTEMEKEIRRLKRQISADCCMIHDIEYMMIFPEISKCQQNISVCTPKE